MSTPPRDELFVHIRKRTELVVALDEQCVVRAVQR
jgi:hypothetical protein